jgi:hypothetical protein
LWVDAIYINQPNLDERGTQVKIMRRIHEHAAYVIVWLGFISPCIEDAFSLASQLAEIRHAIPAPITENWVVPLWATTSIHTYLLGNILRIFSTGTGGARISRQILKLAY